jgi:hypothetical protein
LSTNWQEVADHLKESCPSEHYRSHTVHILSRVERLGPLGETDEEFRRVYTFLHYNEPHDVRRVVRELLERASGGRRARLHIHHNAWRYTVAAYDQWYGHARIMYLAAGLIEGTLRSRLNERLTTVFGSAWTLNPEAMPSSVRESPLFAKRADRMIKVEKRLTGVDPAALDLKAAQDLLIALQKVAKIGEPVSGPTEAPDGSAFLAELTLSQLQSFFQTERLHGEPAQLKELLRDPETRSPVPLSQIRAQFNLYRVARNEVAHYSLGAELSFAQALFTSATIARWLNVDLQHFYGSVDVRQSTELSRQLAGGLGELGWAAKRTRPRCDERGCTNPAPYDWMLVDRAPCDGREMGAGMTVRGACLVHRVTYREAQHQHVGL